MMNVVLFCAGYGSRLRPITNSIPKCLAPVGGIPLLAWWLYALKSETIDRVFINVASLACEIEDFLKEQEIFAGVQLVNEPSPIGTLNTLKALRSCLSGSVVMCHADNFCPYPAEIFDSRGLSSIGVFIPDRDMVSSCGMIDVQDSKVVAWDHKPLESDFEYANAAIFHLDSSAVDSICSMKGIDICADALPVVGVGSNVVLLSPLLDIGTENNLRRANSLVFSSESLTMRAKTIEAMIDPGWLNQYRKLKVLRSYF